MFPQITKPFKSMIQFFQHDSSMLLELSKHQNNNIHTKPQVSFSAQLIATLQAEHFYIVELYRKIAINVQCSEFSKIPHQLGHLKREFHRHLMQEDLLFYGYIEQNFADQPEQISVIKNHRKEVSSVSNRFNKFVDKWQIQLINPQNIQQFQTEYNAMGDLLTQHLNQEEMHIYPFYRR